MGVKAATAMRSRGIATVDDLVTAAMLDPQLAQILVAKVRSGGSSPGRAERTDRHSKKRWSGISGASARRRS